MVAEEGHLAGHEDRESDAKGKDIGLVSNGVPEHRGRAAHFVRDAGLPLITGPGGTASGSEIDDGNFGVVGDFDVVLLVEDLGEFGGVTLGADDKVGGLVGLSGFLAVERGGGDDFGTGTVGDHDLGFVEELKAFDLSQDVVRTKVTVVDTEIVEEFHGTNDAAAETTAVEFGVHVGGYFDVSTEDGDDVAEVLAVGSVDPEVFVGDGDLVVYEGIVGLDLFAFEEFGDFDFGAVGLGGLGVVDFEGLPGGGFRFPIFDEPDDAVGAVA